MEEMVSRGQDSHPTAFISYSHDSDDHKEWVRSLAAILREHGITTVLDQWDLELGDNIPFFIETAIRDNGFTLVICTPGYKEKSERREGGVGYEAYIITAAIYQDLPENIRNSRFIPILREGNWRDSVPDWISGSYGVDLSGDELNEEEYGKLLSKLHSTWPYPPPVIDSQLEIKIREIISRDDFNEIYEVGDRAVDSLLKIISDGGTVQRKHALQALSIINPETALDPLIKALDDFLGGPEIWDAAAEALGNIGDKRAVEPLMEAVYSNAAASVALGKIGDPVAIPRLVEALSSWETYVRDGAVEGLIIFGKDAVDQISHTLEDGPPGVRHDAAMVLGCMANPLALEPLIEATSDESNDVRVTVAWALGNLCDVRAVEPLIRLLKDDDITVRKKAAEALHRIGTPEALDAIEFQ